MILDANRKTNNQQTTDLRALELEYGIQDTHEQWYVGVENRVWPRMWGKIHKVNCHQAPHEVDRNPFVPLHVQFFVGNSPC